MSFCSRSASAYSMDFEMKVLMPMKMIDDFKQVAHLRVALGDCCGGSVDTEVRELASRLDHVVGGR